MQYFGKILGAIIGLLSGIGIRGLIIGFVIGYIADKIVYYQVNSQFLNKKYKNLFLNTTFQVIGFLKKSKGIITHDDLKMALLLMKQMNLNEQECCLAKQAFIVGKNNNYPLRDKIKELKNIFLLQSDLVKIFLEIQVQAALSDGIIHNKALSTLYIISEELGFSKQQFDYFLRMIINNNQNYQDSFFQKSYSNHFYKQSGNSIDLKDAYKILGVTEIDEDYIIKKSYKKLMSKNHPDKLIGSSSIVIEKAKEKTQRIRLAYDLIKKTRGFK